MKRTTIVHRAAELDPMVTAGSLHDEFFADDIKGLQEYQAGHPDIRAGFPKKRDIDPTVADRQLFAPIGLIGEEVMGYDYVHMAGALGVRAADIVASRPKPEPSFVDHTHQQAS